MLLDLPRHLRKCDITPFELPTIAKCVLQSSDISEINKSRRFKEAFVKQIYILLIVIFGNVSEKFYQFRIKFCQPGIVSLEFACGNIILCLYNNIFRSCIIQISIFLNEYDFLHQQNVNKICKSHIIKLHSHYMKDSASAFSRKYDNKSLLEIISLSQYLRNVL